jgi:hypothetical protein
VGLQTAGRAGLGRVGPIGHYPASRSANNRPKGTTIMLCILRKIGCALFFAFMMLLGGPISAAEPQLPVLFVHGNGDTAGLWITTIWRFESNG